MRVETHVTPIIIVFSFVQIYKNKILATPYIARKSFVQVWRGEEYKIPRIILFEFEGVGHMSHPQ